VFLAKLHAFAFGTKLAFSCKTFLQKGLWTWPIL